VSIAKCLYGLGDTDSAMQVLEELARDYPNEVYPWLELGKLAQRCGYDHKALNAYKRCEALLEGSSLGLSRQGDSNLLAWLRLKQGVLLAKTRAFEEAEHKLRQVQNEKPEDEYTLKWLAFVLRVEQKWDEALSVLGAILRKSPQDDWAQQEQARAEAGRKADSQ
jgi:tetratricopeptide (TPR) repeat protein